MTTYLHLITLILFGVFTGGCAIFVVEDTYMTRGNKSELIDLSQDDVQLKLAFGSQPRFGSVGILGAPIIPIYIKLTNPNEIHLELSLKFQHIRDYSFSSNPCLKTEGSTVLYPFEVEVWAVALYQDDGSMHKDHRERWHTIMSFYDQDNDVMRLKPSRSRIDRALIYDHYDYLGTPEFDNFRVYLKYKFRCPDGAPDQFTVDTKDLVLLENIEIPATVYQLERTKDIEYEPLVGLQ